MKFLLEEENKDFMMLVYTGTDRMSHQLINKMYSEDESESAWANEEMRKFFAILDGEIGELLEILSKEEYTLFVMSDHGFHRRDKGFYINQWLIDAGYLALKEPTSLL